MENDTIYIAKLLMLGAMGRNAGKTEFAVRLIRRFSAVGLRLVAVKATAIAAREGPHGDRGVCAALDKPFEILEEKDGGPPHNDTMRMLHAGATRVFWLRVHLPHIAEAARALAPLLSKADAAICESNSLRLVIQPDLFLVFRVSDETTVKPSCQAVIHQATRQVTFNGQGWDLPSDRLRLDREGWSI